MKKKLNLIKMKNLLDDKIYIKKIVQKVEKDINQHLNEILLAIDSFSIYSLDISIQEFYGKKIVTKEDLNYLINQCKQIIFANNEDKDILHTIISKVNFDNNIIENLIIFLKKLIMLF